MRYPSWEGLLLDALVEASVERLPEKVTAAENALFKRSQEISYASDAKEEKAAIRQALDDLLRIKTDKLGWPRITLEGSSDA
jgi:hypothetical protein